MESNKSITIARGDGIGPEIMEVTLRILEKAKAKIDIEEIEIGEKVYRKGIKSGIEDSAWDILRRTKVFLKSPITTPQGGGFKSLNVTTRKALGLYANIRPCITYNPFVHTEHPKMDIVIIRENEEDLYAGIEYRQSQDVYHCIKLISKPGCEKIIRYAFEYAKLNNRKKVSCFTKDNIMKLTDGLFHKVFEEISIEYPEIKTDHFIIDIGSAKIATNPEIFDVIVTLNLYGDIISDIAAEISGSVGLVGTSNIGDHCSMFEAIHGSAPDLGGKNIANPSGLILSAVQMLVHIGQNDTASTIHNAWLKTIEDGVHTLDIFSDNTSKKKAGTKEFGEELINRLGESPNTLPLVKYEKSQLKTKVNTESICSEIPKKISEPEHSKELIGVDIYIHENVKSIKELANELQSIDSKELKLQAISNRGQKVWPNGFTETFCVDQWRCRYINPDNKAIQKEDILNLLKRMMDLNLDFIKTENLCRFDGIDGWSAIQGL